jgi:peptide chain release factor 2
LRRSGGFFDVSNKIARLSEIDVRAQDSSFWNNADGARDVLREKAALEEVVKDFQTIERLRDDASAALDLAKETADKEFEAEAFRLTGELTREVERLEFRRKMIGKFDKSAAILEINCGAGGTEAQDWAEMLLRMYLRWGERKGFTLQQLDFQPGEGAGIKSATLLIEGEFAYGHLRGEQGVHRLVRISPFDSNARRHTSFAAVGVSPDIEEEVEIDIPDKDLKMDTFRSSGAGGQHVNKTDSAVRITHIPSGIIVACQNERSQHKNRAMAMKILKAKLYEQQQAQAQKQLDEIRGERKKIEFGSQIRSYVMQPYQLVKDLRTDYETSSIGNVLDGDIDQFIESYLMSDENQVSETSAS